MSLFFDKMVPVVVTIKLAEATFEVTDKCLIIAVVFTFWESV